MADLQNMFNFPRGGGILFYQNEVRGRNRKSRDFVWRNSAKHGQMNVFRLLLSLVYAKYPPVSFYSVLIVHL